MHNSDNLEKRNKRTMLFSFSLVLIMAMFSFAFVPIYNIFCQLTGLAGTPKIVLQDSNTSVSSQKIQVRFDANVDKELPWKFIPLKKSITTHLGKEHQIVYSATNKSNTPISGMSTFNVTPLKAAKYFNKIECFCFQEQLLEPNESASFPVTFYLDPELGNDELTKDVKAVTLSYTFYRTKDSLPLIPEDS